jgi:tetratricopeptide (TPR) repeat protein
MDDVDWMGSGLADLVQVYLQEYNVEVLDRDVVHHWLAEQRLSDSGLTGEGHEIQTGRLLGAQYLLSGSARFTSGEQWEIRTTVTDTQTTELLASEYHEVVTVEDFVKQIPGVVSSLVEALGSASHRSPSGRAFVVMPEALMRFYRGVDACAKGWPEDGVYWFIMAFRMDTNLIPAKIWEHQAYRMAGFDDHAEVVARELSHLPGKGRQVKSLLKQLDAPGAHRTLSITMPTVVRMEPGRTRAPEAEELRRLLLQVCLDHPKIRLFDPGIVRERAAEGDLGLSGYFDPVTMPQAGRWMVSDGVLFTRVDVDESGMYRLRLQICDPLTGGQVSEIQRTIHELSSSEVGELLDELLSTWTGGVSPRAMPIDARNAPAGIHGIEPARVNSTGRKRFGLYLDRVRRKDREREARLLLIEFYWLRRLHEHAALEFNKVAKGIAPGDPDEPYWLYILNFQYEAQSWPPQTEEPRPYGNEAFLNRFQSITNDFPQSLPAGFLFYHEGRALIRKKAWGPAIENLTRAEACFEHLRHRRDLWKTEPPIVSIRANEFEYTLATTLYWLAACHQKIGDVQEARHALTRAAELCEDRKHWYWYRIHNPPFVRLSFDPSRPFPTGSERLGKGAFTLSSIIEREFERLEGVHHVSPSERLLEIVRVGRIRREADPDSVEKLTGEYRQLMFEALDSLAGDWRNAPGHGLSSKGRRGLHDPQTEYDTVLLLLRLRQWNLASNEEILDSAENLADALRVYYGILPADRKVNVSIRNDYHRHSQIADIYSMAGAPEMTLRELDPFLRPPTPLSISLGCLYWTGTYLRRGISVDEYRARVEIVADRANDQRHQLSVGSRFGLARCWALVPDVAHALPEFDELLQLGSSLSGDEKQQWDNLKWSVKYHAATALIELGRMQEAADHLREIIAAGEGKSIRTSSQNWDSPKRDMTPESLLKKARGTAE